MTEHLITTHLNHVDQLMVTSSTAMTLQYTITDQLYPSEQLFPNEQLFPQESMHYDQVDLAGPDTRLHIAHLSPSMRILEKLLEERLLLDTLTWREFEELVAGLLEKDGYTVTLGRGTKDGGKDLIATKELPGSGHFMAVWQAKKLLKKNKVGLSVIRELADTRNEHKASKGIIVTTTYLTSGALARVEQDRYLLGKVDRDDLIQWFRRMKRQ